MCGIVGLIDQRAGRVSPALLASMRDVMTARGPDGDGQYLDGALGMAMRRLSVIDLEGGWQPFFSRDREIVVFQNGEIYNYRELRRQLEAAGYGFRSQSDTEVLAHGYDCWGIEGLLTRLDGMYALAILDRRRRELHLARDRFGEKPLFFAAAQGRFAYASNLVALAALDWVDAEIDAESLNFYLALHFVPGTATICKGIGRLLPGERLVVALDEPVPRRHRYYQPTLGSAQAITDEELAARLEAAVESRLAADVPVGVFLSGGLDSSIVAAIAASKRPQVATFSMGFASAAHDESRYAEAVARAIGSDHHHFRFDEESFRELLPQVAAALDEPVGDQAQLPLYWLCREARRRVTVALAGEGADEVFAGYGYYRRHLHGQAKQPQAGWRARLTAMFKGGVANAKAVAATATLGEAWLSRLIHNAEPVTPSGFPLLTDVAGRERLVGSSFATIGDWEAGLMAWLDGAGDGLQRAAAADLGSWLPDDLLVKFDRMAMAHSLEGRAPYLAPAVVEAGLRLPQAEKMDAATSKIALRRIARRWLSPEILERPKQGFVLPMRMWLRQWFAGQPSVADYFSSRQVQGLDMAEVARLVEEDVAKGVERERLLFALVMLVEWHQAFQSRRQEIAATYREGESASARAPR